MRVDKWTLGLAAVGLVSLPAVVQAEEKELTSLQTALSSTVISGYINTAARWNPGTGNANPPRYAYNDRNKQDAFSLDVVELAIEKPLDEDQWAAGYRAAFWFGQDANSFGSQTPLADGSGDFAIREAYVALRAPVGRGLDFKVGVFDTVVGYESHDAWKNPNYTRSYAYTMAPASHTGVLGSYQIGDLVLVKAGIANTYGPSINENANDFRYPKNKAESFKTYMAGVAVTAPEDMGFLAGSVLYGGVVNGFSSQPDDGNGNWTHWYVGTTMATPVKDLRVGAAFDYSNTHKDGFAWTLGGYASFQATEKLSIHGRVEYLNRSEGYADYNRRGDGISYRNTGDGQQFGFPTKIFALTGTVQYDLWRNVISRLEVRWDHSTDGSKAYGGRDGEAGDYDGEGRYDYPDDPTLRNSLSIIANIIYVF